MLAAYVGQHPELVGSVGKVYQWNVTNPDLDFVLDLKNGEGSVTTGTADHDTSIEIEESELMGLMRGEADAQKNEMAGFTVAEVSFSIFPALHAQSAG